MNGILLSGGLDSTALAYWKKPDIAFTIDYGQKAAQSEIIASKKICEILNMQHHIITLDMSNIGSGDLLNTSDCKIAPKSDWWPYRNQLLLTIASSYILSHNLNVNNLLFGTVRNDDYHKDGTFDFFNAFNNLLSVQEGNIKVLTPAIKLTATTLIRRSKIPLNKISWAHSCHKSNYACGQCRGCYKHQSVLEELGWDL